MKKLESRRLESRSLSHLMMAGMALSMVGLAQLPACTSSDEKAPSPAKSAKAPAEKARAKKPAPVKVVPVKHFDQKVWIIGFDGVDPDWLEDWADQGKLPNVKKLMTEGSFQPLRSTNPPQSPVAWTSFITGANPGNHGIYDFIKRDPKTYFPAVATSDVKPGSFAPDGIVTDAPMGINHRTGRPFWNQAADHGVQVTALNVPYTFPPEPLPNGEVLSGLGTPDLRSTNSTFSFFSTQISAEEAKAGVAGGRLIRLEGSGPTYVGAIDGPRGPKEKSLTEVSFTPSSDKKKVEIRMGEQKAALARGEWSDWFDFAFDVTPKYSVRGIARFYVVSVEPLEVFMYPPNIHPEEPWIPFTAPKDYSARLKKEVGFFKTVGWTHDTNALNSEKLDDKPWLDDTFYAMDKITEIGMKELVKEHSLFIWVETATDRVAHMMTRVTDPKSPRYDKKLIKGLGGDPILLTYQRMDKVIGQIMSKLTPDTTLLIISDHGFHTYRRGLNTNTWLLENGYLTLREGKEKGAKTNLYNAVDWSRTKAYALGTGQVYINLMGREGKGIVTPVEYKPLVEEITAKLSKIKDEETGESPVVRVYTRDKIYSGVRFEDAPDMGIAFKEGWRTSWETMLGGIPDTLFSDNTKKWSGDHAASDVEDTSGILLSNRKIEVKDPAIVDLASTVLSIFDVPGTPAMEGRDLFGGKLKAKATK